VVVKANEDIRAEITRRGLCQWQIADAVGVHYTTLCAWLRVPLTDDRRKRIMDALERCGK